MMDSSQIAAQTVPSTVSISFLPRNFVIPATVGIVSVLAMMAIIVPVVALIVIIVLWGLVALLVRPHWTVALAMISIWAVRPAWIPLYVRVMGRAIYLYEVALLAAVVYAVLCLSKNSFGERKVAIFGLSLGIGLVVGIWNHAAQNWIVTDSRGVIACLAAYFVASRVGSSPAVVQRVVRVIKPLLWWNLGMIAIAGASGLALAGRIEIAGPLVGTGLGATSTRFLTSSTHFALAVTCVLVVMVVTRQTTVRAQAGLLIPAGTITFLSFSRNSILCLVCACLFAVFSRFDIGNLVSGLSRIGMYMAIAIGMFFLLTSSALDLPGGRQVHRQVATYAERVISGFGSQTISKDASAGYRRTENAALLPQIATSPVVGHGFGFPYKQAVGRVGTFTAADGRYYAHDVYLWLLVKTGVVGLGGFLYLALSSVFRRINRGQAIRCAMAATAVGLLVVSIVAPLPESSVDGGSIAIGAVLGLLAAVGWENIADVPVVIRDEPVYQQRLALEPTSRG